MARSKIGLLKICAVGLGLASWCVVLAGESSSSTGLVEEQSAGRDGSNRTKPMDVEGLDPKLADVLLKYYNQTFGGPENWSEIQSVRFDGLLHLANGTVRFTAFKKKPNYSKVVIYLGERDRYILSYDGEDAWQLNTMEAGALPQAMPAEEAKNFIRDATIGGHLMFPQLKGKQIRLLDVTRVEDRLCYQLEVKLPGGERIISCLDVSNFAELSQTTLNTVNGLQEITFFSDFRYLDRVRFPFASRMLSDGQAIHRVEMLRIRTNLGITPWMFMRESEALTAEEATQEGASESLEGSIGNAARKNSFNFGESPSGQSAFPDLKEDEFKSILKALDELSSE